MSKLLYIRESGHRKYYIVEVDGKEYEIKNPVDEKDAIAKAEYLASIRTDDAPSSISVKEAINIVINSDLSKEDKSQLSVLSAKLITATEVEPK